MMQTYSEKRHPRRFLNAVLVAAVFAFGVAVSSPLHADTYQFIISGYPAENVRYEATSAGSTFVTTTRAVPSGAREVDARYRTWYESIGIAMRSDKVRGAILIFR